MVIINNQSPLNLKYTGQLVQLHLECLSIYTFLRIFLDAVHILPWIPALSIRFEKLYETIKLR